MYQLLRERSWDRLPYLLRLYWYEDTVLRAAIQKGARERSVYASLSKEEAEKIRHILYDAEYKIPEKLAKSIEFDLRFIVRV